MRIGTTLLRAAAAVLVALGAAGAGAQEYPARPLRVIVPFSPGGAVDGPTRVVASELARRLGQQVVVENRPGAGATIGAEAVAKAVPDGYTLLLASQTNAISATLYAKLAFNAVEDFAPISLLGREPGVLVVHPAFPARTVAELIAHVRRNPGKVDYASSGNGSGQHLFAALFNTMAGVAMNHVPYRGSGQATTDLLAGQVQVSFPGLAGMLGHIRAGKLRALAVTGTRRSAQLPDVPTLDEAGVRGYAAYVWMGMMAPRATPAPIVARLQRELVAALGAAEVRSYFENASMEPVGSTAAEFGAFFREEKDRWAVIIRETGARID
ncbi:MAG: tripartite tricarboxylate transporter substrate binding protein [Burkholderiales bacterium]|nr:tripartite tricarboxylate transporter substrate binding protein [Burkholderiales bacterium]